MQSIPIAYVLMEAKTRISYQCVFDFLKSNLLTNLSPKIIITDYETALRDSLLSSFGGIETRAVGCWFHHNQVNIYITIINYLGRKNILDIIY